MKFSILASAYFVSFRIAQSSDREYAQEMDLGKARHPDPVLPARPSLRSHVRTWEDVPGMEAPLPNFIFPWEGRSTIRMTEKGNAILQGKSSRHIVDRLVCSMMFNGRNNGKKLMARRIVYHAFEMIHMLTHKNPIQVFVDAVQNGGVAGGAALDEVCQDSPARRVNQGIIKIAKGARKKAFKNPTSIAETLAQEILSASQGSQLPIGVKKQSGYESLMGEH